MLRFVGERALSPGSRRDGKTVTGKNTLVQAEQGGRTWLLTRARQVRFLLHQPIQREGRENERRSTTEAIIRSGGSGIPQAFEALRRSFESDLRNQFGLVQW